MILDFAEFLPLANLVAANGVKYFVEPRADNGDGLEAAQRLSIHPFVSCAPSIAPSLAERFPNADIYEDHGVFLETVVAKLAQDPAIFWLDPNDANYAADEAFIETQAGERDWFVVHKAALRV